MDFDFVDDSATTFAITVDREVVVRFVLDAASVDERDALLRDWRRLGVACEAAIFECASENILDEYPAAALAQLEELASAALLATLPKF